MFEVKCLGFLLDRFCRALYVHCIGASRFLRLVLCNAASLPDLYGFASGFRAWGLGFRVEQFSRVE